MLATLLAVAVTLPSQAQAEAPDVAFARLLKAAKANPAAADFTALRLAFSKTSHFRPYPDLDIDFGPVEQELKNGEYIAALAALDRVMDGHWTDITAHAVAASLAERMKDANRFFLHRAFERGLIDSILDSGDGRSFETAWKVINVAEEYVALVQLRLQGGTQKLLVHDGHRYDAHTFRDDTLGREIIVYFNVDIPFERHPPSPPQP